MTDQKWVLEWSLSANNFSILPLHIQCARNQQAFIDNAPLSDYATLMVGEKDTVHAMADSWRERIKERDRVRNQPRIRATN